VFAIAIKPKSMGLTVSNNYSKWTESHSLFFYSQQTALMEGDCECFNGNVRKNVFHVESFISIHNIRLQTKVSYKIKRLSYD